jgi:hypothetical protein
MSLGTCVITPDFFNNRGRVVVETGALNLSAAGSSTGEFTVAADATLTFNGGTQTLEDGARFTGDGLAQVVNGGTVVINGSVSAQNFGVYGYNDSLTINGSFRVNGNYTQTGGIVHLSSTSNLNVQGDYTQTGGILDIDIASIREYGSVYGWWHGDTRRRDFDRHVGQRLLAHHGRRLHGLDLRLTDRRFRRRAGWIRPHLRRRQRRHDAGRAMTGGA